MSADNLLLLTAGCDDLEQTKPPLANEGCGFRFSVRRESNKQWIYCSGKRGEFHASRHGQSSEEVVDIETHNNIIHTSHSTLRKSRTSSCHDNIPRSKRDGEMV